MGKQIFETYSLTELKGEAADVKLGWVTLILEALALPGSPMPGNLNTVLQTLFGQFASSRDYLGAFLSTKIHFYHKSDVPNSRLKQLIYRVFLALY